MNKNKGTTLKNESRSLFTVVFTTPSGSHFPTTVGGLIPYIKFCRRDGSTGFAPRCGNLGAFGG